MKPGMEKAKREPYRIFHVSATDPTLQYVHIFIIIAYFEANFIWMPHPSHPPWFDTRHYIIVSILPLSWGSSVSIGTWLWAGRLGFNSWQGQWWDFFSLPPRPERLWGPPSLLSNWYRGLLTPGVKRSGREADPLPQSSAEIKNAWSHTSTSPVHFHGVVLTFNCWEASKNFNRILWRRSSPKLGYEAKGGGVCWGARYVFLTWYVMKNRINFSVYVCVCVCARARARACVFIPEVSSYGHRFPIAVNAR
jgi:hypothetical protein